MQFEKICSLRGCFLMTYINNRFSHFRLFILLLFRIYGGMFFSLLFPWFHMMWLIFCCYTFLWWVKMIFFSLILQIRWEIIFLIFVMGIRCWLILKLMMGFFYFIFSVDRMWGGEFGWKYERTKKIYNKNDWVTRAKWGKF